MHFLKIGWSFAKLPKKAKNCLYFSVNFVELPCSTTQVTVFLWFCDAFFFFFECLIFTLRTIKSECFTVVSSPLYILRNCCYLKTLPAINDIVEYFENTALSPVPCIDFHGAILWLYHHDS